MVNSGVPSNQTCNPFAAPESALDCVAMAKPEDAEYAKTITAKRNGRMTYDLCFKAIQ